MNFLTKLGRKYLFVSYKISYYQNLVRYHIFTKTGKFFTWYGDGFAYSNRMQAFVVDAMKEEDLSFFEALAKLYHEQYDNPDAFIKNTIQAEGKIFKKVVLPVAKLCGVSEEKLEEIENDLDANFYLVEDNTVQGIINNMMKQNAQYIAGNKRDGDDACGFPTG